MTLTLTHFKNYQKQKFEFHPGINCFVGNNGMGKTNVLDAIYTLAMAKSQFLAFDRLLIQEGESFFRIEGLIEQEDSPNQAKYVIKYPLGGKKIIEQDGVVVPKRIDHIGKIPLVFMTPDDQLLVQGGSLERRKFLDHTIAQFDQDYLRALSNYNKLLRQRNAHLQQQVDTTLLDVIDAKMSNLARIIIRARHHLVEQFQPFFENIYNQISGGAEVVKLVYKPNVLEHEVENQFRFSRARDILLKRTRSGPHRDDLIILINRKPARQFASQGQLKSILLAMKLTQLHGLRTNIGGEPLFLIDDLFDKLDEHRVRLLMEILTRETRSQIFVTYTNKDRLEDILKEFDISYKIFEIVNGAIKNEEAQ